MWHDLISKGDLQAARKKLNLENEFLISFLNTRVKLCNFAQCYKII
jgi:hypothetical protein